MKKTGFLLMMLSFILGQAAAKSVASIFSPNKAIVATVDLSDGGVVTYSVTLDSNPIIGKSDLGLVTDKGDLSNGLDFVAADAVNEITDEYTLISGKRTKCTYIGNEQTLHFKNAEGIKLDVIFRVADSGVAFRYYLPEPSEKVVKIKAENSSFRFMDGTKAFISPCAEVHTSWCHTNPSYEEPYIVGEDAASIKSIDPGYIMPATFQYGDVWLMLAETAVGRTYCGTRVNPDGYNYKTTFPNILERKSPLSATYPEAKTPWFTPWRTITISNGLAGLMESTLETDLAEPAIEGDFSWVKAGRSSWSWIIEKDNSINYKTSKTYIDYAADMGWEYCLIDADWDTRIGYDKLQELIDYAATKNVGILVWYNSAGSWNTVQYHPKDKLTFSLNRKAEFERIHKMGVKGIKADFFCGDGQSMMAYYDEILKDAATYKLMVNFHGTTHPRGWHRTYPNLVTMESVKGMEFITFEQRVADVQPKHTCTLPFTRNVNAPMDFTPVNLTNLPNINRRTSSAYELALSVIFQSGVQHFATTPGGMSEVPAFVKAFMTNIPGQWEDVKFIDGYPGEYVIIARKANNKWYIGAINGTNEAKEVELSLSFIEGKVAAELITDGETNRSFVKSDISLKKSKKLKLTMAPTGGFVISTK